MLYTQYIFWHECAPPPRPFSFLRHHAQCFSFSFGASHSRPFCNLSRIFEPVWVFTVHRQHTYCITILTPQTEGKFLGRRGLKFFCCRLFCVFPPPFSSAEKRQWFSSFLTHSLSTLCRVGLYSAIFASRGGGVFLTEDHRGR